MAPWGTVTGSSLAISHIYGAVVFLGHSLSPVYGDDYYIGCTILFLFSTLSLRVIGDFRVSPDILPTCSRGSRCTEQLGVTLSTSMEPVSLGFVPPGLSTCSGEFTAIVLLGTFVLLFCGGSIGWAVCLGRFRQLLTVYFM